jgi:hypothetical protein
MPVENPTVMMLIIGGFAAFMLAMVLIDLTGGRAHREPPK